MSVVDVFAVIDSTSGGHHVIHLVEQFAKKFPSYVSAAVIGWRPPFPVPEVGAVDELIRLRIAEVQREMESDTETMRDHLVREGMEGRVEGLFLDVREAGSAIGMRARHAGLSIVSRPRPVASNTTAAVLEGALLGSGRPVIIVPPGWRNRPIARTVLVCWKPTREAARAIADAGFMIGAAERVIVVTVDARPSEAGYGEIPGADICAHLARTGATAELINLSSAGRSEAKSIEDAALEAGADLIVMGGYGHGRLQELIFGGVTRAMLDHCETPLFMSH